MMIPSFEDTIKYRNHIYLLIVFLFIVGLTKTAASEFVKQGIRINVVCPGVIRTPIIDRFTEKGKGIEKQFEDMEPIGSMGQPEEVAEAVLWLCSDKASFVIGDALAVDGGWIAQ